MSKIIEMNGLSKNFQEKKVLKNLHFHVNEGEIFGFLGPSGAGKTTTLSILTGQMLPSLGSAKLMGKPIETLTDTIYSQIGVLSDLSGLYERLSVYDNLILFAKIHRLPKQAVNEILEKVGLGQEQKTLCSKLSKGMKQRVMLARTLIHRPKVLFLDEPTSALDPATSNLIHTFLKELNQQGTTIFLTTHRMDEAEKLCDRVAFLNAGEIVEIGRPSDLKLKYAKNMFEILLKEHPQKIYLPNTPESAGRIHKWLSNEELVSIHSVEPNLEEIFLDLTGRAL